MTDAVAVMGRVRRTLAAVGALFGLTLAQGLGRTDAAAQEPGGVPKAAREVERPAGSEWQLGIEMGEDPAGLLRWATHQAGWTFGAGATAGPGSGDIRFRIAPHLRLQRTLVPRVLVGAGLGLEWTRLAGDGNDEESELQWEVGIGWRPAARLLAEAGIRWTDYRNRREHVYVRIAVPVAIDGMVAQPEPPGSVRPPSMAADPPRPRASRLAAAAPVQAALPHLGVPQTVTMDGRLTLPMEPVERSGSGVVVVAANPRGDPDPRSEAGAPNVDRLGVGTEAWTAVGAWSGWVRWRSDLHTDPSIAERTHAATEGLFFPVSISFSAGARWSPDDGRALGVAARHDPQALLWLPHLGQERTARVGSARAEGTWGPASIDLNGTRLEPMKGRSVDALDHVRVGMDVGAGRALRIGLEHERLDTPHEARGRSRVRLERSGGLSARLLAGDDFALRVGSSTERGAWRGDAWASWRSEPELLHYDGLVAGGWMRPVPSDSTDAPSGTGPEGDVWGYGLTAARGPVRIALRGTIGDPVWTPDDVERSAGGSVDLTWTDRLADDRIEGRLALRVAEWGPDRAWWHEHPTVEGSIETKTSLGPALLSARLAGRTALESVRAGVEHPTGAELGLGLSGQLPDLGSLRGMTGSMRLDDVLDSGLAVRVGAPERGRRLTLSLAWISRSGVDR